MFRRDLICVGKYLWMFMIVRACMRILDWEIRCGWEEERPNFFIIEKMEHVRSMMDKCEPSNKIGRDQNYFFSSPFLVEFLLWSDSFTTNTFPILLTHNQEIGEFHVVQEHRATDFEVVKKPIERQVKWLNTKRVIKPLVNVNSVFSKSSPALIFLCNRKLSSSAIGLCHNCQKHLATVHKSTSVVVVELIGTHKLTTKLLFFFRPI